MNEAFTAWTETYLNLRAGIALNILYSTIVIVLVFGLVPFLVRAATKRVSDEDKRTLIRNIIRAVLRVIGAAAILRIWLLGKSSLAGYLKIDQGLMNQIADTIVVLLCYFAGKKIIRWTAPLRADNQAKQFSFSKNSTVILTVVLLACLLKVWIVGETDFATYLGLVSAGLAIALQDIIVCIVGWAFIVTVRPFRIGERIQFDGVKGDVVDVRLFQTVLQELGSWIDADQATGRLISVPNSFVFKKEISNYHTGFDIIFSEIPIIVTFESDWKKAKEILEEIIPKHAMKIGPNERRQLRDAASEFQINIATFDPHTYVSCADQGVVITCRFAVRPRMRRAIENNIWIGILDAFAEEDTIDFAYPTKRAYDNTREGKPGAGGPSPVSQGSIPEPAL